MIIKSDWHIHTNASYDADLYLEEIAENAKKYGFEKVGISDHLNFNDEKFINDLKNSAMQVKEFQKMHKEVILGVELTPIEKPEFDYISKTKTREGYVAKETDKPYPIELALTRDELKEFGVRYAVGAAHWRVDKPGARYLESDVDTLIKEWHRQQMWLACDERVTILGHPWCISSAEFLKDFSKVPRSMNLELAAALKENKKYVEYNSAITRSTKTTDKFLKLYSEFIRELFEMGIPVTYGSDAHHKYEPYHTEAEKYLAEAGFKSEDFSELSEKDFW